MLTLSVAVAACGSNPPGSQPASASAGSGAVSGTLRDTAIELSPSTIGPGALTFSINNAGSTAHEFEVIALPAGTDGAALPVENHVVNTSANGLSVVDEVEEIAPSTSTHLSVNLAAGSYVVICNIAGHYESGMHATFTVG